jgi:hypothetical protein
MSDMTSKKLNVRMKSGEVEIHFENGDVAMIDREDLELFASMRWYTIQGYGQTKYLKANIIKENGTDSTIEFHRMIMKSSIEGFEIDHINRNGLDNRKVNLRLVTHQENQTNRAKNRNSTSKYYGVSYDKEKKSWVAQAQCKTNKCGRKTLGYFKSEEDAARYREQKIQMEPNIYSGHRNGTV